MGVTIRTAGDYSIDMSDFGYFDLGFEQVNVKTFTRTKIVGTWEGATVTVRGTDFKADKKGDLASGTLHSIEQKAGGVVGFSISGLKLSVASLLKAADTRSTADERKLIEAQLKGADKLSGGKYDDILSGYDGDDRLSGGADRDVLKGGAGKDTLHGGSGADTFLFKSVRETTAAASGRDTIKDFSRKAGDKIDLKAIDASTKSGGNQAFKFIGDDAFHKKTGELRYEKTGGKTLVTGDVNGDGKADFSILFDARIDFVKSDFIL